MFDAHANLVSSLVAVAPSPASSGTSLTVSTGDGIAFPAVPFNCTVWPAGVQASLANSEIIRVTNVVGDVLTITRHQEGTSARSILVGDQIALTITAKTLQDVEAVASSAFNNSSNFAGTTSGITGGSMTLNTAGVAVSLPAYLTTAGLSQDSSKYAGTGFTTASTAGTNIVGTLNNSGLSVGIPAYLTTAQPAGAYLTTAALSQDSSKYAGIGFTSTSTAGSNVVGTLNTSGLLVAIPNYLTTAMASNAAMISNIKVSAGTLSNNLSAVTFSDSNGVSWGLNTNSVITATVKTDYQTSGAYLTTAALSQDSSKYAGTGFTTATTAGTNIVGTHNTAGLSMGIPAYLTTAALSANTSNYAGTNTSLQTTSGTDLKVTLNTTGLTVAYPAWITTAALSSQTLAFSLGGNSGTTNSSQILNGGYLLAGGANITIQQSNNTISISGGAGAGGIAASNSQTLFSTGTVAFSEGGGAITIASSAGGQSLMFSVPQTSSIVGVAPASISTNGSTISIQVSAIMGLGVSNTGNTAGNVGYLTASNYALAGSGSITLSQSTAAGAATCYIQHPAWLTTAALSGDTSKYAGVNGSVATTAGTDLALTLNTSGATIGYPKWITTAAQSSAMMSFFENMPIVEPGSTTLSAGISAIQVVPFIMPCAMSIGFLRVPVSMSYVSTEVSGTTANSTWTVNVSYTDAAMILIQNGGASSLSLKSLTSSSATWVFQNQIGAAAQGSRYSITQNVTYPISGTTSNYQTNYAQSSANVQLSSASMTLFTGPRWLDIPMGISLSAGNYWLALGRSTQSATQAGNSALGGASAGFSYIGVSQNNLSVGFPGAVTNSSIQLQPGLGSWSTNSLVMSTASIQLASVSAMSSGAKPYFQFIRYA